MVEVETHEGLSVAIYGTHPVRIVPDQKTRKAQLALLGFYYFFGSRRLGGEFQWRAGVGHNRIDDELVITDLEF